MAHTVDYYVNHVGLDIPYNREYGPLCPHGEPVKLDDRYGYTSMKSKNPCGVCQKEHVEGIEQGDRIKAMVKAMPKPARPVKRSKLHPWERPGRMIVTA